MIMMTTMTTAIYLIQSNLYSIHPFIKSDQSKTQLQPTTGYSETKQWAV